MRVLVTSIGCIDRSYCASNDDTDIYENTYIGRELSNGKFANGNKWGQKGGRAARDAKALNKVLLNALLDEESNGMERVVNCLLDVRARRPEAILALAQRLLPKELNVTGDKQFAPIIVDQSQHVHVEQSSDDVANISAENTQGRLLEAG